MTYPWQQAKWRQLIQMLTDGRLPHAFMFLGIRGIGKTTLANAFVQYALCEAAANEHACGSCHACRLVLGGAHPNVLAIGPEKEGAAIKVDQIREVNEFASQTALEGKHKFVIIRAAHAMNVSAANALLKTLEEPSSGTVLILVCDQLNQLPATIASRCHRLLFPQPDTALAVSWLNGQDLQQHTPELLLNLANGAPLQALALADGEDLAIRQQLLDGLFAISHNKADPLELARVLHTANIDMLIHFMLLLIQDLLKLQLTQSDELCNTDYKGQIQQCQTLEPSQLVQMLDKLQRFRAALLAGIHLNKQLMLEELFVAWSAQLEVAA